MILRSFKDAYVLDKPSGVATHTPDGGHTAGFLEMASQVLNKPLWAVHRLDRDTSGCLLVTTAASAVEPWTERLIQGQKKYIFLSHRATQETVWSFEGRIEKTGAHRFELVKGAANSFTRFGYLGSWGLYHLYEAEIFSGKTHQIRIHAQACGIPILGDQEHGGKDFLRLMLHAQDLELDGGKIHCPRPRIFDGVKNDQKELFRFLISLDRRRFLIDHLKKDTDIFRLVHREWTQATSPKLCVEKLGPYLQILNYQDRDVPDFLIHQMMTEARCEHFIVRSMINRGQTGGDGNNVAYASPTVTSTWVGRENGMRFQFRASHGLSSGLFLDQRDNRQYVLTHSQGKRVANFFCYTGGLSVAAALGGAIEVVSVDTSKAAIDWARENFKLNGLIDDRYEFFVADSLFFLKAAQKRQRQFDLILIDPPTFSRGKHGVFRLQDQLGDLLGAALSVLAPHGRILFTTNDEKISLAWIQAEIEKTCQELKRGPYKLEPVRPPFDFEFPLERKTVFKGYWLSFL